MEKFTYFQHGQCSKGGGGESGQNASSLRPPLLHCLLINSTFHCKLNQRVLLVLCVRDLWNLMRVLPSRFLHHPTGALYISARIFVELYSLHLNVHNKCSTFYCMPQTFSARDLVQKHVAFRHVMNQQNSCENRLLFF